MHGVSNIFAGVSESDARETCAKLFDNSSVKIERIVSHFHASPEGFWYDQVDDEWVMVLKGEATLEFAGGEFIDMKDGDYLLIPRGVKHRVARTGAVTFWLAIHVK